ncbi:MAG: transposase [Oscillospiraceae bacterium]
MAQNFLLKKIAEHSIIVLDNATFHKKPVLPHLARAKHCGVWFSPPCSANWNPIEKKWAWLKPTLGKTLRHRESFDGALYDSFQVNDL